MLHPGAVGPVPQGRTGLYHVAIHLPTRKELARAVARLFAYRYANSPTDHTVSETTYLSDPDGNGIELTLETPERGEFVIVDGQYMARTTDGQLRSGPRPGRSRVALRRALERGRSEPADAGRDAHRPRPPDVRDLAEAERFYGDAIGFRLALHMPAIGMSDFTLDAHMIPHALAINTWMGPARHRHPKASPAYAITRSNCRHQPTSRPSLTTSSQPAIRSSRSRTASASSTHRATRCT